MKRGKNRLESRLILSKQEAVTYTPDIDGGVECVNLPKAVTEYVT